MKKTKIDWCDCTINPVVGCPRNCEYCYACKMNNRFKWIPWTKPQFFQRRLLALYETKKSKTIFMNSMSDIAYWKEDWIKNVVNVMIENPQHKYIFLSKSRTENFKYCVFDAVNEYIKNTKKSCVNLEIHLGQTVTKQNDVDKIDYWSNFLSIEPILEQITIPNINLKNIKQIIIGSETGNRKNKVIPKKEWVDSLVEQCDKYNIKVFMKESLRKLMGSNFRQDELIWAIPCGGV